MFRHVTMEQARKRTREEGYCYHYFMDDDFYKVNDISDWSDEVDMVIFCTPNFYYFQNKEDLLHFRLKWC